MINQCSFLNIRNLFSLSKLTHHTHTLSLLGCSVAAELPFFLPLKNFASSKKLPGREDSSSFSQSVSQPASQMFLTLPKFVFSFFLSASSRRVLPNNNKWFLTFFSYSCFFPSYFFSSSSLSPIPLHASDSSR